MPAKRTGKKAAKKAPRRRKPTAQKEATLIETVTDTTLRITRGGGNLITSNVMQKAKLALMEAKGVGAKVLTLDDMHKPFFPTRHITIQQALGTVGFAHQVVKIITAPDDVGKTSYIFNEIGDSIRAGFYVVYIDTEDKILAPTRIKRLLSFNREEAEQMFNDKLIMLQARTLEEFDCALLASLATLRKTIDESDDCGAPIRVYCDTWGSLLTGAQAAGRLITVKEAKKKVDDAKAASGGRAKPAAKRKEAEKATNMGHAKHAHHMARWIPSLLRIANADLTLAMHQNDKIDMGGGFAKTPASRNETSIGGNGLKKLSAYRMVLVKGGSALKMGTDSVPYAQPVLATITKNKYGPPRGEFFFDVIFRRFQDTATTTSPALSLARPTAYWAAENKALGVSITKNMVTCDAIGAFADDPETFYRKLMARPDVLAELGQRFGIMGHEAWATSLKDESVVGAVDEFEIPANDIDDKDVIDLEVEAEIEEKAHEPEEA